MRKPADIEDQPGPFAVVREEDVAAGLDAAVTALETGTQRPVLAFQGK